MSAARVGLERKLIGLGALDVCKRVPLDREGRVPTIEMSFAYDPQRRICGGGVCVLCSQRAVEEQMPAILAAQGRYDAVESPA